MKIPLQEYEDGERILPKPEDFYLNEPLYSIIPIDYKKTDQLKDILFYLGHLDCYCVWCEKDSTFMNHRADMKSAENQMIYSHMSKMKFSELISQRSFSSRFICVRDPSHIMQFDIVVTEEHLPNH